MKTIVVFKNDITTMATHEIYGVPLFAIGNLITVEGIKGNIWHIGHDLDTQTTTLTAEIIQ